MKTPGVLSFVADKSRWLDPVILYAFNLPNCNTATRNTFETHQILTLEVNMGRFSHILSASLVVLGSAAASAVIDLKPDNFDGELDR